MTTTATRRAALCCALLATTCLAAPAIAQGSPSIYKNVDDNGVDLTDGSFNFTLVEGTIGAGKGAIALTRLFGAGGERDNLSVRFFRSVQGGAASINLEFGDRREEFSGPAGASAFASRQGSGATLSKTGASAYVYRAADGTATSYGPPPGLSNAQNNGFCSPGTESSCELIAVHTTRPDGLVTHYNWDVGENCDERGFDRDGEPILECAQFWRLRGLSNTLGRAVSFSFQQEANPTTGLPTAAWHKRVGATLGPQSVGYAYLSSSVTEVTDAGGRAWRLTRDAQGRIAGIRRPGLDAGAPDGIAISYAGGGLVVSQVVRDGVTTSYARSVYGSMGTMTRSNVVGGATQTTTIVSDLSVGRPVSVADPLGRTASFSYDANGRPKRTTADEGNYVELSYDARGNVTQAQAVAKGGAGTITTAAAYPATCANSVTCNQPESSTDARGNLTAYTYDPVHGGVTTVTGPAVSVQGISRQPQTRFGYTAVNGVAELTAVSACRTTGNCANGADEVRTTIGYGPGNLPASTTTGAGDGSLSATTAMTYDALGDLLTVDGPLPGAADTTRLRYNASREQVGAVSPDPDGAGPLKHRAQRSTIDGQGLVTKVESGTVDSQSDAHWAAFAPLEAVETGYDGNARPVTSRLVAGGTLHALSQTSYDALGRPECAAVRMNPAAFGSLPASACSLGTEGGFGPDRIGRTIYDAAGQVAQVRTAVGVAAEEAAEVTTTYTDNGQVLTLTDAENNRTTYEYDGFDRLKRTLYPVAAKGANQSSAADYEELTYDPASNVTKRRNRAGEEANYTLDALDRVTLRDLPGTEPDVTYGYDLLGRTLSATQPGHALGFSQDALGRLLSETSPRGTVASQYDLAGRRTRLTYPDGYYVTHEHLVTGEVSAIKESGTTMLASFGYDDRGRRTLLTRGNGASTSYLYDPVSRLSQLSHDMIGTTGDVTYSYAYNPAGQIVTRDGSNDAYAWTAHGSGTTASSSNGLNQLATLGANTVTHDARGNLLADGQDRTFGYSSENLLTSFQKPSTGAPANPFGYDPLTRFVTSGPSGGYQTSYLYDPVADVIVSQADPYGEISKFVHGPGQDEPLFALDSNGRRNWFHADERGSVIARSNADGTLRRIVTYDEYGKPGANLDNFMYTGAPFVLQGTYLMRNRFYDYTTGGRFPQPDPARAGMNDYAYVGGDPVNKVDPSGLEEEDGDVIDVNGKHLPHCQRNRFMFSDFCNGGGNWGMTSYFNGAGLGGGGGSNQQCPAQSDIGGRVGAPAARVAAPIAARVAGAVAGPVVAGAALVGAILSLKGDSFNPTPPSRQFHHYTTNAGRSGISLSGYIRPSSDGFVYLTPDVYSSGAAAQSRLALSQRPTGYFNIPSQNVRTPSAPSPVTSNNNQPGGGTEITTPHPVPITGATWSTIC